MWILCPLILYKGNPSSNHKMHLSKQFLFEFELRHQNTTMSASPRNHESFVFISPGKLYSGHGLEFFLNFY